MQTYPDGRAADSAPQFDGRDDEVTLVHPPVAKPGYVEQVHVTYARVKGPAAGSKQTKKFG